MPNRLSGTILAGVTIRKDVISHVPHVQPHEGTFRKGTVMSNTPTPEQVVQAAKFRKQVREAQADRERRARARANGYRGPLTRRDLAARVGR